jgi:S-adenosylmethionine hydrolase
MSATIYLLSDFGASDTYVAQMKSVLISGAPEGSRLVDLTHDVPPGSITEGAFHLWAAGRWMAPGSVVLAVVDPGVGTSRRGILVRWRGVHFVGPDNGIFGLLPIDEARELPEPPAGSSRTFHGRDLFAPCAARIATDPGWVSFLRILEPGLLTGCSIRQPVPVEDGVEVSVAHVDGFGNILLWMDPDQHRDLVPRGIRVPDGGEKELLPAATYGDSTGLICLRGSQGCMELAVNGGSAGDILGLVPGDRIVLLRMDG